MLFHLLLKREFPNRVAALPCPVSFCSSSCCNGRGMGGGRNLQLLDDPEASQEVTESWNILGWKEPTKIIETNAWPCTDFLIILPCASLGPNSGGALAALGLWSFPGKPGQCPSTLWGKNFFLTSSLKFPWHSSKTSSHWKSSSQDNPGMMCTSTGNCLRIKEQIGENTFPVQSCSSWEEVPVLPGYPGCDSSREMDTQKNSTVTLQSPGLPLRHTKLMSVSKWETRVWAGCWPAAAKHQQLGCCHWSQAPARFSKHWIHWHVLVRLGSSDSSSRGFGERKAQIKENPSPEGFHCTVISSHRQDEHSLMEVFIAVWASCALCGASFFTRKFQRSWKWVSRETCGDLEWDQMRFPHRTVISCSFMQLLLYPG